MLCLRTGCTDTRLECMESKGKSVFGKGRGKGRRIVDTGKRGEGGCSLIIHHS